MINFDISQKDVALQSFTKYLIQTLVLCKIVHYGKSSNYVFQEIITSTNKIFSLAEELSTIQ